tara:strand:+ start:113 stop:319 length:207 start_codon:yes stop_codon:yes gene_type:complete
MKKFIVTYAETVVKEVEVMAETMQKVYERFEEGNFPFTQGKDIARDMRVTDCKEIEKKTYNFTEGDCV